MGTGVAPTSARLY
ncbi:hypothetical protein LINGRAHAP2_LOCUS6660 [Linum grandiflorum]